MALASLSRLYLTTYMDDPYRWEVHWRWHIVIIRSRYIMGYDILTLLWNVKFYSARPVNWSKFDIPVLRVKRLINSDTDGVNPCFVLSQGMVAFEQRTTQEIGPYPNDSTLSRNRFVIWILHREVNKLINLNIGRRKLSYRFISFFADQSLAYKPVPVSQQVADLASLIYRTETSLWRFNPTRSRSTV